MRQLQKDGTSSAQDNATNDVRWVICWRRWPEVWALLQAPKQQFEELSGKPKSLLESGLRLIRPDNSAEQMASWAAERLAAASLDAAYWRATSAAPGALQAVLESFWHHHHAAHTSAAVGSCLVCILLTVASGVRTGKPLRKT